MLLKFYSKLTREDAEEFKKDMEEEMKNVSIGYGLDDITDRMKKFKDGSLYITLKTKIKNKKRRILKKMFNTQNFNLTDEKAKIENVLNIIYALEYLYEVDDKTGIVKEKKSKPMMGILNLITLVKK